MWNDTQAAVAQCRVTAAQQEEVEMTLCWSAHTCRVFDATDGHDWQKLIVNDSNLIFFFFKPLATQLQHIYHVVSVI